MERKSFNWREFLILWAAGVWGVIAVLPYTLTLQAPIIEKMSPLPVPLSVVIAVQVAQNAVLVAAAVGLGLLLAARIGLGVPLLEARLTGGPVGRRLRALLLPSVLGGVAAGIAIIGLDVLLFAPRVPAALSNSNVAQPPAWQGLLASFYGGITEELFMRLFLMSLLAWLLGLVWREEPGPPAVGAFWTANLMAAILFGLGHLPATAALVPLTGFVVIRAIVLNGVAGVVFGHLYWKRGLEAAMLAHFSTDIVLHVLTPLLLGQGGG